MLGENRRKMEIRRGGNAGERGIEKHLPSLLESRAVITELRRSERGGGREQRYTRGESRTQCTRTKKKKVRMEKTHE